MKQKIMGRIVLSATLGMMLSSLVPATAATDLAQASKEPQAVASAQNKQAISTFEKRVKLYVKQRERVKRKLPKLSKDSTPEQIQANEKAFVEGVRAARSGAKPGDIFTPDIANYIRVTLKEEFQGADKKEIRKIILDDETKPVPLRVNYPYPDANAFTEMPATLLLTLPPLPKQVKHRFVRRNLFLVDTDNNLVIDYMLDALP